MEAHRVRLGGRVALALDGLDVDQDRCAQTEGGLERMLQLVEVVAVEDADVGDPDVLEEPDLGPAALEALLRPGEQLECRLADERDARQRSLGGRLRLLVGPRQAHLVEAGREPADRWADAHLVVVQDDQQRVLGVAEVVERLHRQSRADRRIADADGNPLPARRIGPSTNVASGRQADADADAGPGVAAVEDVVLALGASREAADAADLAQRVEPIPSVGQELVRVGLVAGVPHDAIPRGVHHPMQRERDLDGAQRAGKVSAGLLNGADHLFAQLRGQGLQLLRRQVAQLRRLMDRLEQRQGNRVLLRSQASIGLNGRARPPASCSDERLLEYVTALDLAVAEPLVEPMRALARAPGADDDRGRAPITGPCLRGVDQLLPDAGGSGRLVDHEAVDDMRRRRTPGAPAGRRGSSR